MVLSLDVQQTHLATFNTVLFYRTIYKEVEQIVQRVPI